MGSWQDCPVGFSHWTFPLKEACCLIMKLVSKLCLVSINYKSWSRLTRGGDESNRLWAIILSTSHMFILSSSYPLIRLLVPSYPLFNSSKSLDPAPQVDCKGGFHILTWTWSDGRWGDNQVICHWCHWVTTQSPIGTQSSTARPPIWNCPGSIWNS